MKGRLIREDARNVRVENFLTVNADDFAQNTVATAKTASLKTANAGAAQERLNQLGGESNVRQNYEIYTEAFNAMVSDMEVVRDFSVSIARDLPGIENKFQIPKSGGKSAKIAAAYVFADEAEEIKQKFTDAGLKEDFVIDLRTKADAAKDGLNMTQTSKGKKVGATNALGVNVKTASQIVEDLHPIVKYIYRDNPAKLAEWISISKVENHTPTPKKPPEE